jgi:hypothetical protein
MKKLGIIALLTVLAVGAASTCWAVTVPPLPAGADYLKSRNEDQGATYVVGSLNAGDEFSFNPTGLLDGVPTPVLGMLNGVSGTKVVTKLGAVGAIGTEDSWGIALLYQIAPGHINNPGANGTIVGFTGPIQYDNSAGTQSTWCTAMFHSGVDVAVDVIQGSGTGGGGNGIPVGQQKETIKSTSLAFELYAVDSAAMDAALAGAAKDSVNLADYIAASRTAVDKYLGWSGNTLPAANSVLLATGTSDFFQSTVVVDATGTIVSNSLDSSTVYFDVPQGGPGLWNSAWGASDELRTPDGIPTNLWFQWTLDNGQRNWTVHSDDIGGAFAVPEPLTLMGLVVSVAGVGNYLRRRRLAKA